MRTKEEHIQHWLGQAQDDWDAVETLFKGKKFLQSLFFAHLVIEKICKAHWIRCNTNNIPPRSHNLMHLLESTQVNPTENQSEFMLSLNRFQLEGRYPEYYSKLRTVCDEQFTKKMIDETDKLRLWLLKKLE